MARFVVLLHEMPPHAPRATHWDFMLEQEGGLRTWALQGPPVVGETVAALELAVHRLAYLQYEGPVSADRGSVMRWDEGRYEPIEESAEQLELLLSGRRLRGRVQLERSEAGSTYWTFRLASE